MSDHATMTMDDAIRDLGSMDNGLPRAALQWTLDHWTEAAPRLLALLAGYADGSDRSRATANALFFALHLLAEKSETAGFPDLCRMLREPDIADVLLGDATTTTLRPILISMFDGDIAMLRGVVEAPDADEYVRYSALLSMAWFAHHGRISRPETHAWLRGLFSTMQPQSECFVWVGLADCVAVLGFADLAPLVRQLFERALIGKEQMEYRHFEADLQRALENPDDLTPTGEPRLQPFGSTVETLSRWYGFSEKAAHDKAERAARLTAPASALQNRGSYSNPWRDVGRNDPCPCGSGVRFKKCCLGKATAETIVEQGRWAA